MICTHGGQRLEVAPGTSPPYNRSAKRRPGEGLCEGAGRCVANSHDGDSAGVPCVAVRRRMHGRVVVLWATVPFFASAVSDGLGGGAGRCVADSHDGDSVGVSCVAVRRRMHGRVTELRATHPFFASAERSMQKTPLNQNQTLNYRLRLQQIYLFALTNCASIVSSNCIHWASLCWARSPRDPPFRRQVL